MHQQIFSEQLYLGIYVGIIFLAIVNNVSLYIRTKEKSTIYLVLFIVIGGGGPVFANGANLINFWPGLSDSAGRIMPLLFLISLYLIIEYIQLFLRLQSPENIFEKGVLYERGIFIIGLLLLFFLPYVSALKLIAVLTIVSAIVIFAACLIYINKGNERGKIIIKTCSLLFLGFIIFQLRVMGYIPANFFVDRSFEIGFLSFLILSSVIIPTRYREEEKHSKHQRINNAVKNPEKITEGNIKEEDEINKINLMLVDRAIELGSINKFNEKINSSLRFDEVIQGACKELLKLFPIDFASIGVLSDKKDKLTVVAYQPLRSNGQNAMGTEINLASNDSFLNKLKTGKPFIIEKVSKSPYKESFVNFKQIYERDNVFVVPIISISEIIGAMFLAASDENYKYSPSDLEIARAVALLVAGSVEKAQLFSQKEKALNVAQTDLEIGRQIQSGFFPEEMLDIKGWEVFAHFKAARQVSGDFYDVFQINSSKYTAFIIGDVCDKGVGAALFMVLFRTLLRAYSQKNETVKDIYSLLREIILNTNNYIAETHYNSNMFASIFFGILDSDTDEIHYVNAGLEPPVVINSGGDIINKLYPTGPVIGMFPNLAFTVVTIKLKPGDILFAYTDGTTDAKNSNRESFSDKNLLKTVAAPWSSGFSMLYDLNSNLFRHIGSQDQYDDITQIAVRKKLSLEENKHSIIRKASQDNLEDLRNFIEKAAIYCKLSDDKVFAYKLATEEICTNIIKYGYDGIEKGEIKLEFLVDTNKAVLKIIDYGKQFIPEEFELPDINEDWEDRKIGGLGITLVNGLMDKVQYSKESDNSNCITLELKIV